MRMDAQLTAVVANTNETVTGTKDLQGQLKQAQISIDLSKQQTDCANRAITSTGEAVNRVGLAIGDNGVQLKKINTTLLTTDINLEHVGDLAEANKVDLQRIEQTLVVTHDGILDLKGSLAAIDKNIDAFTSAGRTKVADSCHLIPYPSNHRFSGRQDLLDTMQQHLVEEGAQSMRSVALTGMPGVGKTQLALKFAHLNNARFKFIFWISASSAEKILQDFDGCSKKLGLRPDGATEDQSLSARLVNNWLRMTCKNTSKGYSSSLVSNSDQRNLGC
jgi:hypothetical protein